MGAEAIVMAVDQLDDAALQDPPCGQSFADPGGPDLRDSRRRRVIKRAVLGCVLSVFCAPMAAQAATPQYPNLKTLQPRDLRLDTADVSQDDSGDMRNVLRFSNTVWNAGPGKLSVYTVVAGGRVPARQRVYDDAGDTAAEYETDTIDYHDVHRHWHFDGWGEYELWTNAAWDRFVASGRESAQVQNIGAKTTSCIFDNEFVKTLAQTPWPFVFPESGCYPDDQGRIEQGLSVGWGDTYFYDVFEQWIDLGPGGTLADGAYVLRSVTDPTNKIYESADKSDLARESDIDNEAITKFEVVDGQLVDSNAPSGTVSINNIDETTTQTAVNVQVIGRDDISGVDKVRLSNDGVRFRTFDYTGQNEKAMNIDWDLADASFGGSTTTGVRTVYAQFHDRSGKWSSSFNDTITLNAIAGTSTPPAPPAPPVVSQGAPVVSQGAPVVSQGAPGASQTSTGTSATSFGAIPPFAAKLELARAGVLRSVRRLSVLAPITARAAGRVKASFRAAGRTERFTAGIDAAKRRIRIDRSIPASQARLGTGILTLTYPGDDDTQPQEVRLRAASQKANLHATRPKLSGRRLTATGTISTRARGVVRLQLLYEPADSSTRTLEFTAPISDGRYSFDETLPADIAAEIGKRRGVVHSYTLFTGYLPRRVRGEMRSYEVLPAR